MQNDKSFNYSDVCYTFDDIEYDIPELKGKRINIFTVSHDSEKLYFTSPGCNYRAKCNSLFVCDTGYCPCTDNPNNSRYFSLKSNNFMQVYDRYIGQPISVYYDRTSFQKNRTHSHKCLHERRR